MINNNSSLKVSRSWSHGVDGNQGGIDSAVPATSKKVARGERNGDSIS